ncbi:amidase [Aestuariivita boseongensis]|uniref:amidase n=1 Tax=Aestuariivita boseongensis TaxID=1470562 RepID=UPI000683187A|nr:amidase [Aestuariivita boseongensis]
MPQKTIPSAAALLDDLRAGKLRATDIMEATLERIGEVNDSVNAIVNLRDADTLMAEARAADDSDAIGALHGLPIAVKDLADVAGIPTTKGSPMLVDNVLQTDEIMVARMRAAGAILIGKTNTPEFGLGSHTFNPVHGVTRNPYNTGLSCGGSSGGAAVALATGMTLLADGSDMMGSLRNPAGWNNVYGFRPSWGLVPSEPLGDTFLHQLSTLGPMARSPEDIGLLLDVIAGPDPRQPHNMVHEPVSPVSALSLSGVRIAWMRDWDGAFPMEEGVLDTCEAAIKVLRDLGAEVDTPKAPFDAEAMFQSWATLRSWQVGVGLDVLAAQGGTLKDTAIWELERGRALSGFEVHAASVVRSDWFQSATQFFETYDAFVLPTAQVWPFSNDIDYPREIAGVAMDTYHRWMAAMVPASLLGLPALAAPAGFGQNGLPMGIQLIGPRGSDGKLLRLGAAYHAATQWPDKRPPEL